MRNVLVAFKKAAVNLSNTMYPPVRVSKTSTIQLLPKSKPSNLTATRSCAEQAFCGMFKNHLQVASYLKKPVEVRGFWDLDANRVAIFLRKKLLYDVAKVFSALHETVNIALEPRKTSAFNRWSDHCRVRQSLGCVVLQYRNSVQSLKPVARMLLVDEYDGSGARHDTRCCIDKLPGDC